MEITRRTTTVQFLCFSVIGGIATATQYAIFGALAGVAHVPPVRASALAFGLSALMNYGLNYRITFKSNKRHLEAFTKFSTIAVVGLALNTMAMASAIQMLQIHYIGAQLLATALVVVWNFAANRAWTFQVSKEGEPGKRRALIRRY